MVEIQGIISLSRLNLIFMKRITTRELASRVGCSQATVSLALRNDPRISAPMRRRVQEEALSAGYRADPLVAKLMASVQRRRLSSERLPISYLMCWDSLEAHDSLANYREFRKGAGEQANELGYKLEVHLMGRDSKDGDRWYRMMKTRGLPGVIIGPVAFDRREAPARSRLSISLEGLAAVTFGASLAEPKVDRVWPDTFQSVQKAVRAMWASGIQRVGFVSSRDLHMRQQGRGLGGYLELMFEACPERQLRPLLLETLTQPEPYVAWLREERPEVVLAVETPQLEDLLEGGRRSQPPPRLISLDLEELAEGCTGLYQQARMCGKVAFNLLISRLHCNETGIPGTPRIVMVPGVWVNG